MNWQETAALGIVMLTAGAFVWRQVRSRRLRVPGGCGCGCAQGGPAGPLPRVTFRAQKGQRAQVIIRSS